METVANIRLNRVKSRLARSKTFLSFLIFLISIPWLYGYAYWLGVQFGSATWTFIVVMIRHKIWKTHSPTIAGSMRPKQYSLKVFVISLE